MKTNRYIYGAAALLCLASFGACADSWDEHYESSNDWVANAPTLLEHIQSDPDLAPFLRVANHVGFGPVLSSPQTLTLWCPVITEEQADSVIAVYEKQKQELNKKDQDNAAITQFFQNHISLIRCSSNSTTNEPIKMWNGKVMTVTDNDLNGIPYLKKNIVASNGMMYKLSYNEQFLPNVREAFDLNEKITRLADFYTLLDTAYIDVATSVERDVVDGEVVYADSVIIKNNELYGYLGYIQREDSAYLCLAPTDDVWENEYTKYRPLFNYAPFFDSKDEVERRDSIERLNTALAVMRGRFYNLHIQKNEYRDSLMDTQYINSPAYYGLNVFNSFDSDKGPGILPGLESQECSNGLIYIDDKGRIDPKLTFLQARYLQPAQSSNHEIDRLSIGSGAKATVELQSKVSARTLADEATYKDQVYTFKTLKDRSYIEVQPLTYAGYSGNNNSKIYFYLQNTVANMYYNIYVVMVPAYADREGYDPNSVLPIRFQASYVERLETPRATTSSDLMPNTTKFPARETRLTDEYGTSDSGKNYFGYDGQTVQTICLAKALTPFKYSSLMWPGTGRSEATVRLCIESKIQNSLFNKGEQTNIMRINRVIYIPFETAEEANAFELDFSNLKEYKE